MHDFSYDEVVAKAPALIEAFGKSHVVYLSYDKPFPYEKAQAFESGGTYRLGCETSGYFVANAGGLTVKRSFQLEDYSANGSGSLAPRTATIREVANRLQGKARSQFLAWVQTIADAMNAEAAKTRAYADAYTARASLLCEIAKEAALSPAGEQENAK